MLRTLAGGARVWFEGHLSACVFPPELAPAGEETAVLRRATLWPRLGFVVLPPEPDTAPAILDVVLPDRRYLDDIIHIQIERSGHLQFGSYDNFHRRCVGCGGRLRRTRHWGWPRG